MKKQDVIRAWRDEDYYLSLPEGQRDALPAHPAGLIEVSDELLNGISGGSGSTNTDCSVPQITCPDTSKIWICHTQDPSFCNR